MSSVPLSGVSREEALRYMGYWDTEPDASVTALLDRCEAILLQTARPRYLYRVFPIRHTDPGIMVTGTDLLLCGNDIATHLAKCERVVLLGATLSQQTEQQINRAAVSDMSAAVALDALASAAIEQICNRAEEEIRNAVAPSYLTWRFSPGYGDLPLEIQPAFLAALDAPRRLGLTVTETNILTPRKSVTAVIGLSDQPLPPKQRGCAACTMRDRCQFRKKGVHCGGTDTISEKS